MNIQDIRKFALFSLKISILEKQEEDLESIEDLKALKQLRVKYNLIIKDYSVNNGLNVEPVVFVEKEVNQLVKWYKDINQLIENIFNEGKLLKEFKKKLESSNNITENRISKKAIDKILVKHENLLSKFESKLSLIDKNNQSNFWVNNKIDDNLVSYINLLFPDLEFNVDQCTSFNDYKLSKGNLYEDIRNYFIFINQFGNKLIALHNDHNKNIAEIKKLDDAGSYEAANIRYKKIRHIFSDIDYESAINNSISLCDLENKLRDWLKRKKANRKSIFENISKFKFLTSKNELKDTRDKINFNLNDIKSEIKEIENELKKWNEDSDISIFLRTKKDEALSLKLDFENKISLVKNKIKKKTIFNFTCYFLVVFIILASYYRYKIENTIFELDIVYEKINTDYKNIIDNNKIKPTIIIEDASPPIFITSNTFKYTLNEHELNETTTEFTLRFTGECDLNISIEGYVDYKSKINLNIGQKNQHKVYLKREKGNVSFKTSPVNTEVFINKVSMGVTPLVLNDFPSGNYFIEMLHPVLGKIQKNLELKHQENLEVFHNYQRGGIKIDTFPPGASVKVDDKDFGKTPILLKDMPLKNYNLKLTKKISGINFKSEIGAKITDAEITEINHIFKSGNLNLNTIPTNSAVFFDNVLIGKTPINIESFPVGTNTIQITNLVNNFSYKTNYTIVVDERESADLKFVIPTGSININSIPSGREVFHESRLLGITPIKLNNVPEGRKLFKLKDTKINKWSENAIYANINRNQETTINHTADYGSLSFDIHPIGTEVYIIKNNIRKFLGKTPIQFKYYPPGYYQFKFTHDGYKEIIKGIQLTSNRELNISEKLKKYEDGEIVWDKKYNNRPYSSAQTGSPPSLDKNEKVYFTVSNYTSNSEYICYNKDGEKIFSKNFSNKSSNYAPVVSDLHNMIVQGSDYGNGSIVIAYDNISNDLKWSKKVSDSRISQIAYCNNKIYFTTTNGNLISQDESNGNILQRLKYTESSRNLNDEFSGFGPVIINSSLFVHNKGTVFSFNLNTFELKWKKRLVRGLYGDFDPAISNDGEILYTNGDYIYAFSESRYLRKIKWRKSGFFGSYDNIFSTFIHDSSNLVLESINRNNLIIYDKENNKTININKQNRPISTFNGLQKNNKFSPVSTEDGNLIYLNHIGEYGDNTSQIQSKNGLRKSLEEKAFGSVMSKNGNIYIITEKRIYKISIDSKAYKLNNWTMHRGNVHRTASFIAINK